MRILVIDDENDFLTLMATAVRSQGYEVVTAENGHDGLLFAGIQSFDLIITDIFMPEMDGITLIIALRQELPGIPIIAMSGGGKYHDLHSLQTSRNLGAIYSLSKPFDLEHLVNLIRVALSLPPG